MSIPYTDKVNEQGATPVNNESHIIGIIATATYAPGLIRLIQVPQGPAPAVSIPGYIEITSGTPTGNQFLVNYTTGVISFSPSLSGTVVNVAFYEGLGSEISAEDVNELQNPVSAIIQQTTVYNWPSAPTVTWALAPNSVLNSSIAASAAISLTKLQALNPSIVPITDGSGFLISSPTTTTQLSYLDATSSIQTQLNGKQAVGNYIIALSSDVTATGPGTAPATVNSVGGSSAANIHSAELATNAATALNTFSTIVKRDSSGNFSASSITLTNASAIIFNDTQLSPKAVTLEAPSSLTNSYTIKWPLDQGLATYTLQNDGAGNLSWVAPSGSGSTPGLPLNSLQYNNAGAFGGTSGMSWSAANGTLIINTGIGPGLDITAPTTGITLNYVCGVDQATFLNSKLVAVSASPIVMDASAIIQADSTTQGILPPRMTTAQRTAISGGSPATGLFVYDTDLNQWMGYNGTSWVILG